MIDYDALYAQINTPENRAAQKAAQEDFYARFFGFRELTPEERALEEFAANLMETTNLQTYFTDLQTYFNALPANLKEPHA